MELQPAPTPPSPGHGDAAPLGDGGAAGPVPISDEEEGDDGDDNEDDGDGGSYDGATPCYEESMPATNAAVTGSPPPSLSQLSAEDPCDPIQDESEEEAIVEATQASIDVEIAEEEEEKSTLDEKAKVERALDEEFLNNQDSSLAPDLLAEVAGGLEETVEKEKTEAEISEDKKLPLPMEEIPVKSKDLRKSEVAGNGGGNYHRGHSTANLTSSASSSSSKGRDKNAHNLAELQRELAHLKRLQCAKTLADLHKMRMLCLVFSE